MRYFMAALILLIPWRAPAELTQIAAIDNHYSGGFKDIFPQELNAVQSYLTSTQSAIAIQLGLQVGQGFRHPVTIRFEDGAPRENENPFFFARVYGSGADFHQELVANVEAYSQERLTHGHRYSDPRSGFRYAITQIMLNDLAAGVPDKALPPWLQEGLSVYASGSGEALLKEITREVRKSRVREMTGRLNSTGPYLTPQELARDFLAVDFIASHGLLQNFVLEMTNGESPADAVRNAFGYEWPTFESEVQNYSVEKLAGFAPDDKEMDARRSR